MNTANDHTRWLALAVLCLGILMIILDSTIVNVALPSIQTDLGFTETSLVWVVNAYMVARGGFLLLGGRLGDLFGHRRLFLLGITLFTLSSAACGMATSQGLLVSARAVQGISGSVVSAVALSLIMHLFTAPADRARAMGIYGFVCAAGGSIGVLLGGVLTGMLSWHWIFLVNLPIGVAVFAVCLALLPISQPSPSRTKLDFAGSITVTASLTLAVYAIVHGNDLKWVSGKTLIQFCGAITLMVAFVIIQTRTSHPLLPLRMFALRSVATANVVGALWAAAMFVWFFISALYLQRVLNYSPIEVGVAFLPANIIMAIFSLGLSAKLVVRFGVRAPLSLGLLTAALGLLLFAQAPSDGGFLVHVLPGMILLGVGTGVAFNPLLLVAMSDVAPEESGLASGLVNTSFMMGGALGLAVSARIAAMHTAHLVSIGVPLDSALTEGYHRAFLLGTIVATVAAGLAAVLVRSRAQEVKHRSAGPARSVTDASHPQ